MTLDFANALNPQQYLACTHTGSPLLILAGAGSGKTRVLTHRIVYLATHCHIPPSKILAVTFTNKAATEMRERAAALMARAGVSEAALPWIGTFHSICARLLRHHGHRVGLNPGFSIYDDDDSMAVLRDCVKGSSWPDDRASLKALSGFIDACKNAGESPDLVRELAQSHSHIVRANLYALYNQRLRKANAVDFGDLILLVNQLLESHEPTRLYIARAWQHILVDEFQDTNGTQYNLLRLLSRDHNALTVVGDDDQSIYAWRGANVNYMLGFERDFPGSKIIKLEQNYRSSPPILKLAADLIQHNRARHPKRLWTDQPPDQSPPVSLLCAPNETDEARFITRAISAWRRASPVVFPSVAILFRTHAQTRVIEEALRAASVPYKLVGGLSFYSRAEIKDALAYLRILVNDTDTLALRRVINTPPRGIGDATQDALETFVSEHAQHSIWEGLRLVAIDGQGPFTTRNRKAIREFFEALRRWRALLPESLPSEVLKTILRDTTYLDYLAKRDPERAIDTSENVRELLTAIEDFERSNPNPTLLQFLEDTLLNALPEAPDNTPPSPVPPIHLMTIHSAKGLEFDAVFVAGFEQMLMPLQRPGDSPSNFEEERRLAYVAFTRARFSLTLTSTQTRRIYGQTRYPAQSPFLSELDPLDLLPVSPSSTPPLKPIKAPKAEPKPKAKPSFKKMPPQPSPPQAPKPPAAIPRRLESRTDLSPGDSVNHARFGTGIVLSLEPRAGQIVATVDFPLAGVKTIMTSFLQKN